MCSTVFIILFAVVTQARAADVLTEHPAKAQDYTSTLDDKLVDKLLDTRRADLEDATLGKDLVTISTISSRSFRPSLNSSS